MTRVNIHLLVPHEGGPIQSHGLQTPVGGGAGNRYVVACNHQARLPPHATGEARATTCPNCMETDEYKAQVERESGTSGPDGLALADPSDFPPGSPLLQDCGCDDQPVAAPAVPADSPAVQPESDPESPTNEPADPDQEY